jgi:hypothetical protein
VNFLKTQELPVIAPPVDFALYKLTNVGDFAYYLLIGTFTSIYKDKKFLSNKKKK